MGEDSFREAIIDLKQYREDELCKVVDDQQWPLIIRLECMSEQGLQQGHSLSVRPLPSSDLCNCLSMQKKIEDRHSLTFCPIIAPGVQHEI